jgi:nucleotide-binding universal stress UspA family protein
MTLPAQAPTAHHVRMVTSEPSANGGSVVVGVNGSLASLPANREQVSPTTVLARHGHPAEQLLAVAAEGAAPLLVIGSWGRGGFTGLLLGSVGHHCVGRARAHVAEAG